MSDDEKVHLMNGGGSTKGNSLSDGGSGDGEGGDENLKYEDVPVYTTCPFCQEKIVTRTSFKSGKYTYWTSACLCIFHFSRIFTCLSRDRLLEYKDEGQAVFGPYVMFGFPVVGYERYSGYVTSQISGKPGTPQGNQKGHQDRLRLKYDNQANEKIIPPAANLKKGF
ncbi:predicted protein [Nematostella vectensis]|uniref:LITAF domain-containing protein n=1 Tax=Nematostella vectensis TaxID=45351 RepID=A7RR80_NEMVE|nr:predicted protein [Nematostella vectensis]|eukprot:XP_001638130.1 predicted protein [Nematostella vectensis]